MNILIGKLGRSIYFDKDNWSMYAGDEEAPLLYTMLAKRYPQHTFYLVGRSDIRKYRKKRENQGFFASMFDGLEVPPNLIDMFEGWDKHNPEDTHIWLEKKVETLGLKFDVGIIYQGPTPNVGIPGMGVKTIDGTKEALTLEMFRNYYAPAMHLLNVTQTPYFLLCGDPRYVPLKQRDVFNDEKFILSQINTEREVNRISGYKIDELRRFTCKYIYAGIETVFMLNEKKVDFRTIEKPNCFVMGLNGGGDREKMIKEWLLDYRRDIKVYGKWPEEFTAQYPEVFEEKSIKSVEDIFWGSRYTLIPPFSKNMSTFVTQKFWKMIYYGIIPFFHPAYDTEKIFKVPDILRIDTPSQMWERIHYLDANPEAYKNILNHIHSLLDDKYFNGDFLDKVCSHAVKRCTGEML